MKGREEYKEWLESEGLGMYTENQILARAKEKRRKEEERRRDAALQDKLDAMWVDHY